jgi:hypothetical protein
MCSWIKFSLVLEVSSTFSFFQDSCLFLACLLKITVWRSRKGGVTLVTFTISSHLDYIFVIWILICWFRTCPYCFWLKGWHYWIFKSWEPFFASTLKLMMINDFFPSFKFCHSHQQFAGVSWE